ncbi:MAG: ABC transporter permease subunit [Clostridia bacterium]|nr:ABC transporter permease subunit [Clostridia bacterium]
MTLFFHELKRGRLMLAIWAGAVAFMLGICIVIYPEMAKEMADISNMFADMGAFSAAFGMDELNFGEFMGYFSIECGNTLGLGGALFAALLGIGALAKEERERTAEFLLTHPISRRYIVTQKWLSVLAQLLIFNAVVVLVTVVAIAGVGVEAQAGGMALLFLANLLLQIELAAITFGVSSFLRRGGLGVGLGLAFALYFFNILANLSDQTEFLKFATPFAYTDGAYIVRENALDLKYLAVGLTVTAIGIFLSYWQYTRKDIA